MNTISALQDDDIILILNDNNELKKINVNLLSCLFYNYNSLLKLNKKIDKFNSYLSQLSLDFFNEHLLLNEALDIYSNKAILKEIVNNKDILQKNSNYLSCLILNYSTQKYVEQIRAWQFYLNHSNAEGGELNGTGFEDAALAAHRFLGDGYPNGGGELLNCDNIPRPTPPDDLIKNIAEMDYPIFKTISEDNPSIFIDPKPDIENPNNPEIKPNNNPLIITIIGYTGISNTQKYFKVLNNNAEIKYTSSNKIINHEILLDNNISYTNFQIKESKDDSKYIYSCKFNNPICRIYDVKVKLTDNYNQVKISETIALSILDNNNKLDKYIYTNSSLTGLIKTPPAISKNKTLKMYGRVNDWAGSKIDYLIDDLIKMHKTGIAGYHIELASYSGELFFWEGNTCRIPQIKNRYQWLVTKCRQLGMWLFVSMVNDNMGKPKHGTPIGAPTLTSIYNIAIELAIFIKSCGNKNVILQPVGETQTPAGINYENYAKNNLKEFILVNNNGLKSTNGMNYSALHPGLIRDISQAYHNNTFVVSDHGKIIQEICICPNNLIHAGNNIIKSQKIIEFYRACKNAKALVSVFYHYKYNGHDANGIESFANA